MAQDACAHAWGQLEANRVSDYQGYMKGKMIYVYIGGNINQAAYPSS